MYEELLSSAENSLPTHHKQILIGKVREYQFTEVDTFINEKLFILFIITFIRSDDDLENISFM